MNSQAKPMADNPGVGGVVESIPFSERRIHPGGLEVVLSIARANIPPTHPQLGRQNSFEPQPARMTRMVLFDRDPRSG